MSRRRSFAVFGGAMAAAIAPSWLRLPVASAAHCGDPLKPCETPPSPGGTVGHFCCEKDTQCCHGSQGNACCDPCLGETCMEGVGRCSQGPIPCSDFCCARFGQGECCGSFCCTPDQVCDRSRNICCPPDSDPPKCNRPESACEKRADELIAAQKSVVGGSDHAPGGLEAATSFAILDLFSRYREYDKCPQVADDSACASGGRCDPSTLVCRQCAGEGRRRASSGGLRVHRRSPEPRRRAASRGGVSDRALAERLRERYRARDKALGKLLAVARADREGPGPYPDLAKALQRYRREIVRLRKSFAKGDGGASPELVVEMCEDLVGGLGNFREAALSTDRAEAQRLAQSGEKSMRRGIKRARKLRRVFGCGKRCL